MRNCYKKISENIYMEDYGLYYEDFKVEDIFRHSPGRTITETDSVWQSLISMNQHPLHIDKVYAENTEFKKLLVSSSITLSIVSSLTVSTISAKAIANLGWDKVKLIRPVFVGDTLYAESKILSKRKSKSRKNQGIVTVQTTGKNQNGIVVITFERSFLVPFYEE